MMINLEKTYDRLTEAHEALAAEGYRRTNPPNVAWLGPKGDRLKVVRTPQNIFTIVRA
jgi:hypothetical protein